MSKIKSSLRILYGFYYDFVRYFRYGGWKESNNLRYREYLAVRIYHKLEKCMSFSDRRVDAGQNAAHELIKFYERKPKNQELGYHESIGLTVLNNYRDQSDIPLALSHRIQLLLDAFSHKSHENTEYKGYIELVKNSIFSFATNFDSAESFFNTRHSLRSFSNQKVDIDHLSRAINLARSTPSVCNRQSWRCYYIIDDRQLIDYALEFQSGNRGFGHRVPCLLIITSDLSAFHDSSERYQNWIDGGMFSMNLLLAIHSLNLGACPLNWSRGPGRDSAFRNKFKIPDNENIIMMIGVGHYPEQYRVCESARKPLSEMMIELKKR